MKFGARALRRVGRTAPTISVCKALKELAKEVRLGLSLFMSHVPSHAPLPTCRIPSHPNSNLSEPARPGPSDLKQNYAASPTPPNSPQDAPPPSLCPEPALEVHAAHATWALQMRSEARDFAMAALRGEAEVPKGVAQLLYSFGGVGYATPPPKD